MGEKGIVRALAASALALSGAACTTPRISEESIQRFQDAMYRDHLERQQATAGTSRMIGRFEAAQGDCPSATEIPLYQIPSESVPPDQAVIGEYEYVYAGQAPTYAADLEAMGFSRTEIYAMIMNRRLECMREFRERNGYFPNGVIPPELTESEPESRD